MNDSPQIEKNEINLVDIWNVLVNNKLLILIATIISTSVALEEALTTKPVYRAEALLAPVVKGGQNGVISSLTNQFGGLASIAGISLGGGGDTQNAIAILKSRSFSQQFIQERNLIPQLLDKNNLVKPSDNSDPELKSRMWAAYKVFSKAQKITEDRNTGLVTLAIEWTDPELAAIWVNDLVTRINMRLRSDALKESERNLEFLNEQIKKTSVVDIQRALFGLIESEMKKAMLANVSDEYAFNVIDQAVSPREKIKPNRRFIISFGIFTGLIVGVVLALFRNFIQKQKIQASESS